MSPAVEVRLKTDPYRIIIKHGLLNTAYSHIAALNLGNFAIVTTCRKVYRLHKHRLNAALRKIPHKFAVLPDGEEAKSKENLFKIINILIKNSTWGRKTFVIAAGGGTIGDVTGLACAIYKRGTTYIHLPTTLLAQIDSSIGGKTAIDLKEAKNILGAFHQPKAVLIDPQFLSTLGKHELQQGIAEAIKYAAIKDPKLFSFLEKNRDAIMCLDETVIEHLITVCAQIKARIVEKDEYETKGIRTILNFGHTLAHTLEACGQYRRLTHGEAVAIGMVYAGGLSVAINRCPQIGYKRLIDLIKNFGLPYKITADCAKIYKTMRYDKKFTSGSIRMVLLNDIGRARVVEDIPTETIKKSLRQFCQKNGLFT